VLVPLHGFVRGDTVGLLVLVHDTDTIAQLAQTLVDAALVRLAAAPSARVFRSGIELDPRDTVAQAGLTALERVDLVPEWPSSPVALPEPALPGAAAAAGAVIPGAVIPGNGVRG
jgi:hypothetical protein